MRTCPFYWQVTNLLWSPGWWHRAWPHFGFPWESKWSFLLLLKVMRQGEGRLPASIHTEGNRGTLVFALTSMASPKETKQIQQEHSEELPVMLWSWGMYHCCPLGGEKKKAFHCFLGKFLLRIPYLEPRFLPCPTAPCRCTKQATSSPCRLPWELVAKISVSISLSDSGLVLTTEVSIEMLSASGDTMKLFVWTYS